MSLAARFPLKSASNNMACHNDGTNILIEESEVCVVNQGDTVRWHEKVSSQPIYNGSSVTHKESAEHQRGSETSVIERRSLGEAHSQSIEEEVISQDSFDSSVIQATGGPRSCSGSNSEEEDFITGCRPSEIHFPTLTNLLRMEKTTFQEFYSHENSSLTDKTPRFGQKQSESAEHAHEKSRLNRADDFIGTSAFTYSNNSGNQRMQEQVAPSCNHHLNMIPDCGVPEVENFEAASEESISPWPSTDFLLPKPKDANCTGFRIAGQAESVGKSTEQQNALPWSQETPRIDPYITRSNHSVHQESNSQPGPHTVYNQTSCHNHQLDVNKSLQVESPSCTGSVKFADAPAEKQNNSMQHVPSVPKPGENAEERISVVNKQIHLENRFAEPNSNEQVYSSGQAYSETSSKISRVKKRETDSEKKNAVDWDSLRKQVEANGWNKERSKDAQDSLDYEAIRCANVAEVSNAIKERGMNNMLAERIKVHVLTKYPKPS